MSITVDSVTDERLQSLLNKFNKEYFGDGLAGWKVHAGIPPEIEEEQKATCNRKNLAIYVAHKTLRSSRETEGALIHEMAHASAGYGHGKRSKWRTEMLRLFHEGAPILESDIEIMSNAKIVRNNINNRLLDGASLTEAQMSVADNMGFRLDELIKKYPKSSKGRGGPDAIKKYMGEFPYNRNQALSIIIPLRNAGKSYREIATALNEAGHKPLRAESFSPRSAKYLLDAYLKEIGLKT